MTAAPLTILSAGSHPKAFPLWSDGVGHLPPEAREILRVRTRTADAHAVAAAREWLGLEGVSLGLWG